MRTRKLTLDDVAAAAGVARVTVSRVINRDPKVSDETRLRVSDAIARLGYSVNHQARALASGGSPRIILFHAGSPDREPNSYYDSGLELGALRASSQRGYDLASRTVDPDRPDAVAGLIDFGDALHTVLIAEVAVACAYSILDEADPIGAAANIAAGFHAE